MFVIVPNVLRNEINAEIERFAAANPDLTIDRDEAYGRLLDAYDKHGVVATLERNADATA